MRVMMMVMPKGYDKAAPGTMPDLESIARMRVYNESLQKAGVLLALDGVHPPSMGARISFEGGKPTVTDGPFSESKEVIGGFWMLQVRSMEEAKEWAKRCPAGEHEVLEIRPMIEFTDFPPEVQEALAKYVEQEQAGS